MTKNRHDKYGLEWNFSRDTRYAIRTFLVFALWLMTARALQRSPDPSLAEWGQTMIWVMVGLAVAIFALAPVVYVWDHFEKKRAKRTRRRWEDSL